MSRAILAKQLFRVVEMRDGKPHTVPASSASATNVQSRTEAIKRWRKAKERYPGKDIQLLETEPIVWVSDSDPHPECTFSEWRIRTLFKRNDFKRANGEDRYYRKCSLCDAEEWTDVPDEYVDKAIEGLHVIEGDLRSSAGAEARPEASPAVSE